MSIIDFHFIKEQMIHFVKKIINTNADKFMNNLPENFRTIMKFARNFQVLLLMAGSVFISKLFCSLDRIRTFFVRCEKAYLYIFIIVG